MASPFSNQIYLELLLQKSLEQDEFGNWIVTAEASNEELDAQDQITLQRALLDSKEYFLKNGVISYDHRHLTDKKNPEQWIIGEPIDVIASPGNKTFVRLKLYKSNPLAREIAGKLSDGSTRVKTSIGGRRPMIENVFDSKLGKMVERVKSVLWNELAMTWKPVNQKLSPAVLGSGMFVKSLTAGYGTDSATMTGGRSLIMQDLEGVRVKAMAAESVNQLENGVINNAEGVVDFLVGQGLDSEEVEAVVLEMINSRQIAKGVRMKGDVEAAIAELDALQKSEDDAEYDEGDESDEDGDEGEGTMDKSLESEMGEEAQEFLDVSNFLTGLFKSLNNLIKEQSQDIKNLRKSLKSVEGRLEKSLHNQGVIAKALTNQDTLLKSIGDQPLPREAKLSKSERFEPQKPEVPGRDEIKKALPEMKKAGLISIQEAASAEESLNKSLPMSTRVAAKVAEYFGGKK